MNECFLTGAWNIAGPYIMYSNYLSCCYCDKCSLRNRASDFTYTTSFTHNHLEVCGWGRGGALTCLTTHSCQLQSKDTNPDHPEPKEHRLLLCKLRNHRNTREA